MFKDQSRLLVLAACLIAGCAAAEPVTIRGVDPKLASRYSFVHGAFACLSGGKELSADRVNDNYCDCPDGSDEPGTAACPDGKFYCRNRGHVALVLNASVVDDGICDCCDGSDEPPGHCRNRCWEQGVAARNALKTKLKAYAAGVKVRDKRAKEAAGSKKGWQSRIAAIAGEEAALKREVDELAEKKRIAEEKESKVRERKAAADRAAEEARKAAEQAAEEQMQPPEPAADPAVADPVVPPAAASEDSIAEELPDNKPAEEEVEQAAAKSDEELARERMSQWVKSDDAAPLADDSAAQDSEAAEHSEVEEKGSGYEAQEDDDDDEADWHPSTEDDAGGAADNDAAGGAADNSASDNAADDSVTDAQAEDNDSGDTQIPWYSRLWRALQGVKPDPTAWELETLAKAASAARDAWSDKSSKHSALLTERTGLESKLGRDYGPDDVFLPLDGQCFSSVADKYTYEVCPFGQAAQKEGASSTSLGSFSRFEDEYRAMVFENGQHCWSGPNRSIRLMLLCGAEEKLVSVEEPSRCTYTAQLATPALCTHEDHAALRAQSEVAETEAAAIRDEL